LTDRDRVELLGVPLDPRTRSESVASLVQLLERPDRCAHVVTLNPEYVIAARRDSAFLAAIQRADLILADGAGVVAAARALGIPGVERLTGVEIVEHLAENGTRLFFLGAGPGVAESARAKLSARFPTARIVGTWSGGSPNPSDDDESILRIAASGAEAVAVAYGAEGQVLWIERNRERLSHAGVRLAVGVGGSFDYLSGLAARPPEMVRRAGMEWLWRLGREPWRWRRQLALPRFALLVLRTRIRRRSKH
jgi:N-acetylglucosaminyldiphosphoundecaprenol N-acetyl-beta-D-mannosaminyltransferase